MPDVPAKKLSMKDLDESLKASKQESTDLAEKLDKTIASTQEAIELQDQRMGEQAEQLSETNTKLDQILKAVSAANLPASFTKVESNAGAMDVNDPQDLDETFDLAPIQHANVDSPEFQDKMKLLAFMEEIVEIRIATTSEPQAEQIFEVSVNGADARAIFVRGMTYKVPRKIVEGLVRAKPIHYVNHEFTDPRDGIKKAKQTASAGLRYNFEVLSDPNPKGQQWLSRILQEH